jgi:hypothetical protein
VLGVLSLSPPRWLGCHAQVADVYGSGLVLLAALVVQGATVVCARLVACAQPHFALFACPPVRTVCTALRCHDSQGCVCVSQPLPTQRKVMIGSGMMITIGSGMDWRYSLGWQTLAFSPNFTQSQAL